MGIGFACIDEEGITKYLILLAFLGLRQKALGVSESEDKGTWEKEFYMQYLQAKAFSYFGKNKICISSYALCTNGKWKCRWKEGIPSIPCYCRIRINLLV